MTQSFSVTWDYRCPFARNVHTHIAAGLQAGADRDVTFVPFCLGQAHVEPGEPDVWQEPAKDSGLLALQLGTLLRPASPATFLPVHLALFALRHDKGKHLRDEAVLRETLNDLGVDPEPLFADIASGSALATVQAEHERSVRDNAVWGVPTFIAAGQAAFVRLMHRADEADPAASIAKIDNILLQLTDNPDLNELKHTSIPR